MSADWSPWSSPRPRLLEALRGMRHREEGLGRDLLVLAGCLVVYVTALLLL